jgi:transcription factor SFP1
MNSSPASSSASSPPISSVITPLVPYTTQRAFANASSFTPSLSQLYSECPSSVSVFDTATVLPSRASTSTMSTFTLTPRDSFNTYSAYSDYGAVTSPLQTSKEITCASSSQPGSPYSCISPTFLYSPRSTTPANPPCNSRVASPLATQGQTEVSYRPLSLQASRSTSSPFSEPFRHAKPNYNESHKHLDALGYQVPHVHGIFAPPEDLEASRAVTQKEVINKNESSGMQVTDGELHETERRLRPFVCGIDNCQRRYLDMKGLRTSLPRPGSHSFLLILLICRTSLSSPGGPWRTWVAITRVRAVRMLAAFQDSRDDLSNDSCAQCYNVSVISVTERVCCFPVMALSAGLWSVPVLAG